MAVGLSSAASGSAIHQDNSHPSHSTAPVDFLEATEKTSFFSGFYIGGYGGVGNLSTTISSSGTFLLPKVVPGQYEYGTFDNPELETFPTKDDPSFSQTQACIKGAVGYRHFFNPRVFVGPEVSVSWYPISPDMQSFDLTGDERLKADFHVLRSVKPIFHVAPMVSLGRALSPDILVFAKAGAVVSRTEYAQTIYNKEDADNTNDMQDKEVWAQTTVSPSVEVGAAVAVTKNISFEMGISYVYTKAFFHEYSIKDLGRNSPGWSEKDRRGDKAIMKSEKPLHGVHGRLGLSYRF